MKKNIYIETYGCQMNEYDSGLVKKILTDDGYEAVREPGDADVILLNTCAVREKAHERVYGRLEILSSFRKKRPGLVIGVLGCMAQNLGKGLIEKGKVDLVLGPDNYRKLPDLLSELETSRIPVAHTLLSREETYEEIEPEVVRNCLAYVTIMRGCNNFCSFCVVPYTRGRERSRSSESIVQEITHLTGKGVREVTLLGQNVNSYSHDATDFTDLVRMILDQTPIERLRFTSPHPHDFPQRLLQMMANESRFAPHIHLPVQSGSTPVLKRMKRDYTREEFLTLVETIRSIVPGIALSTDVMVGFSEETDAEYDDTLSLMEQVRFDMAYMFQYSERSGTVASRNYPDTVPDDVKRERLSRLIELQTGISHDVNQREIGREFDVLVEGTSRRSDTDSMGRTPTNKVVIVPGQYEAGQIVRVRIRSATSATLLGDPVNAH